jgi:hypothetical protein
LVYHDQPWVTAAYEYQEVLPNSLLFYEAQKSGKLPPDHKVKWRKDSALNDKGEQGEHLTGGYYNGKTTHILYTQISIPKKQINSTSDNFNSARIILIVANRKCWKYKGFSERTSVQMPQLVGAKFLRAWERLNTAYYVNYGGGKETLAHFKDNE